MRGVRLTTSGICRLKSYKACTMYMPDIGIYVSDIGLTMPDTGTHMRDIGLLMPGIGLTMLG